MRTRSASDISWPYLAVLMVGICAWLAYGIGSRDGAIIAGNAMTLVLLAWLVGAKLVFELGARPRPSSATAATPGGDPGPTI